MEGGASFAASSVFPDTPLEQGQTEIKSGQLAAIDALQAFPNEPNSKCSIGTFTSTRRRRDFHSCERFVRRTKHTSFEGRFCKSTNLKWWQDFIRRRLHACSCGQLHRMYVTPKTAVVFSAAKLGDADKQGRKVDEHYCSLHLLQLTGVSDNLRFV